MTTQTDRSIRLRACQRCGGDAYLDLMDDPEWRCLQCARLVPEPAATAQVVVSTSTLRAA